MAAEANGAVSAEAGAVHKPIPKTRDGKPLTETERRREFERRMEKDLATAADLQIAPFRAMLFALYDNDAATRMWQQIEPIIRSGPEGVRKQAARYNRMQAATDA